MGNERGNGGGGRGDSAITERVDFAGLFTSRIGMAICQGAIRAGQIGNSLVDAGNDLPGDRHSVRTMKLIGIDAALGKSMEAFRQILERLQDARTLIQDHAKESLKLEEKV